jgi:outer membrane lipoprotein-sorting protein
MDLDMGIGVMSRQLSSYNVLMLGLLALLVTLSGCRMNEAVYRNDGTRIIYARPPLMRVVDELDERYSKIDSVSTRLNITLHDNVKNKQFELKGVYLGDKDGNMRMRIQASTGQLILDMGMKGDVLEVYLPRKGRYFRGTRADMMSSQCELALLVHAGRARDLFFPRAWSDKAIERRVAYQNGREVISVLEKPNFIRRRSRRLTMAPESASVELVEVYDRRGNEVGDIAYGNYVFPDPDANPYDAGNVPVLYPGTVTLLSHDNEHTLEMNVEDFGVNAAIDASKFSVPNPDNLRVQDLGSALKRRANLWE